MTWARPIPGKEVAGSRSPNWGKKGVMKKGGEPFLSKGDR